MVEACMHIMNLYGIRAKYQNLISCAKSCSVAFKPVTSHFLTAPFLIYFNNSEV